MHSFFHQKLLDQNLPSILLSLAIPGRLAHFNTMFIMSVRPYDFILSTSSLTYFYLTIRLILLSSMLDTARTMAIDSSSPASAPRFLADDDMVANSRYDLFVPTGLGISLIHSKKKTKKVRTSWFLSPYTTRLARLFIW